MLNYLTVPIWFFHFLKIFETDKSFVKYSGINMR